jgi:hypothetical protein
VVKRRLSLACEIQKREEKNPQAYKSEQVMQAKHKIK